MLCMGKVDKRRDQPCSAAWGGMPRREKARVMWQVVTGLGTVRHSKGVGFPHVLLLLSSLGNCVVHWALNCGCGDSHNTQSGLSEGFKHQLLVI